MAEVDGEIEVSCRVCSAEERTALYQYRETGERFVEVDDWRRTTVNSSTPPGSEIEDIRAYGYCPECWSKYRDRDLVIDEGRVRCAGYGCNTHQIHSQAMKDCFSEGNILFTEDEFRELKDEYHKIRRNICPECGEPADEMADGEDEVPCLNSGPNGEMEMQPELLCDCGWSGWLWETDREKK